MRVTGNATLALASLLVLSACAEPQSVSICQIHAAPESYIGKRVLIHGEVYAGRHSASLFDSSCPHSGVQLGAGNSVSGGFVAEAFANGPDRAIKGRRMFAAISGTCAKEPEFGGCLFMVDRVLFTKTVQGKPGVGR